MSPDACPAAKCRPANRRHKARKSAKNGPPKASAIAVPECHFPAPFFSLKKRGFALEK